MENFRSPFLSQSVAEFWRNWHISLSSFFEITCISRWAAAAGSWRAPVNTMVVFFLCSGLWHGAAWTFVAWGLLHGLYLVCGRLTLPPPQTAVYGAAGTLWLFARAALAHGVDVCAGGVFDDFLPRRRHGRGVEHGAKPAAPGRVPGREAVLAWEWTGPTCCFRLCARRLLFCATCCGGVRAAFRRGCCKTAGCAMGRAAGGVLTVAIFGMYGEGYVEKAVHLFPVLSGGGVNIGGKRPVLKQTRGLPPLVRALAFGCIAGAALVYAGGTGPHRRCIDGFTPSRRIPSM